MSYIDWSTVQNSKDNQFTIKQEKQNPPITIKYVAKLLSNELILAATDRYF